MSFEKKHGLGQKEWRYWVQSPRPTVEPRGVVETDIFQASFDIDQLRYLSSMTLLELARQFRIRNNLRQAHDVWRADLCEKIASLMVDMTQVQTFQDSTPWPYADPPRIICLVVHIGSCRTRTRFLGGQRVGLCEEWTSTGFFSRSCHFHGLLTMFISFI